MTVPLSDAQLAATAAGREAVRAMFSGGAFPAALGQAIADEVADAAMAPLLAEVERLRAELAQARTEPIVARWSRGVTHHDAGTTVECVDVDDPLRGIALELTLDDREALGLMLVDPEGEMDQADDDEHLRADHFNEAADLIVGSCFTHTPGIQEGWMSCHCDAAAALRAVARHAVARQADDTTSKEAWPVTMRLFGGKVVHAARLIPDSGTGVYATACGEADKPGTGGGIVDCVACINLTTKES